MSYTELEQLRNSRGRTLELVGGLSQTQMDHRPAPGKWSVGEILDHLYLYEVIFGREIRTLVDRVRAGKPPILVRSFSDFGFSVPYLPDVFLTFLEPPVAFANFFVPRPVRSALFRSRRIPAEAPQASTPRPGRPADDLRRDLRESLVGFDRLIAENPGIDLRRLRYYQGLLGLTTAARVFGILSDHEQRHQEQIREVLSSPGFPA